MENLLPEEDFSIKLHAIKKKKRKKAHHEFDTSVL